MKTEFVLAAQDKLVKVMHELNNNAPHKNFDHKKRIKLEERIGHVDGGPVRRLVIYLYSNGCTWMKSGGCSHCGLHCQTTQHIEKVTTEDFISQFKEILKEINIEEYPAVSIYNLGSLLCEEETPFESLKEMCLILSGVPTVKQVALESRIEFVTLDKIRILKQILEGKELVVASGLESASDLVRNLVIHKGLDRYKFEKYIETMRSVGVTARIYVLVKPPFLTESEAIQDAVDTVNYLHSLSVPEIHLESITIQPHTLIDRLYVEGYYRVPWLWSIVDLLKRIDPMKAFVSPFRYVSELKGLERIPHNCEKCSARLIEALVDEYPKNYDISILQNIRPCDCKKKWKEEIAVKNPLPLENRMLETLQEIYPEIN